MVGKKYYSFFRDPTLEEFEKRASDCSNPRSFRGIIKSYLSENGGHKSSKSGGDSGILAVKVLHQVVFYNLK